MSIFAMHNLIIDEYSKYVQSFLSINDGRVREFIEKEILVKGTLWPDALLQLNPSYEMAATVKDLVSEGKLHPLCGEIFCNDNGQSIRLYRHQQGAIERALRGDHFVVTSGTGSGKSLTYFIPIFDAVLRSNPGESKVWAMIVYPMNALVNSQYESLLQLAIKYKAFTGKELPVRFAKYTGQEREEEKQRIQQNPPHILLTNYVMLELSLVRPKEHNFVDRTTTALQFLVIDELHAYRGRQGADVALLIRRLRERCGNPNLLCIGTSATMIAGRATTPSERRGAVANFASKLCGVLVHKDNIIEELPQRITSSTSLPVPEGLRQALSSPLPETIEEMLENPLTAWIELNLGLEEPDGYLRRRVPISLEDGAKRLSEIAGIAFQTCQEYLHKMFLKGAELKMPDGNPVFAFKLHQFIAQGRAIYATIQPKVSRLLTLGGQYYAPDEGTERILYPLLFCRICGQDYYVVLQDKENGRLLPYTENEAMVEGEQAGGYLMLSPEDAEIDWVPEHLPAEWLDHRGRIKKEYRHHTPLSIWVMSDGSFTGEAKGGSVKAWFQPKPFLVCLNCGEFYTRREREFRKLTGLSSEGRSTATTLLSVSALQHAPEGGIEEAARKILSFTDNRQDSSLQAGHFNDFVQVSLLRAAIFSSLERHNELRFDDIAAKVVSSMGLTLKEVAANPQLHPDTHEGQEVLATFRDLIEYRIYEDLRRGWRVIQPNLEQCGLLCIEYAGLNELCNDDTVWKDLEDLGEFTPEERKETLKPLLDQFRKKLAISVDCLKEQYQQQLRRRVQQRISQLWAFEESERLRPATRFILSGQPDRFPESFSLGGNSLIGRYLRRTLHLAKIYPDYIQRLIDLLCSHGYLRKVSDRRVNFVQLDASVLIWKKGDGIPPPDPIYSRQVISQVYEQAQLRANAFFRDFYQRSALLLKGIEGREHTAQISYQNRQEREQQFREGKLKTLFCSPTMELGIDIADLQLVHMRNVPPTPANYAQRSGRSGRKGDPALVLTYCAAGSGHDQYFFHHRQDMVSGAVRPPRIDLGNEDLIRAHVHAIWLAKVRLPIANSIAELLELTIDDYPLTENFKAQINLSAPRLQECLKEAEQILQTCGADIVNSGWYSEEWLENVLRCAPEKFDRTFVRFRELYKTADRQWQEANEILRYPTRSREQRERAKTQRREAERQKALLCNVGTTPEESDFYPYRYLASEGFLPGYNFPRLPVRTYIPRGDGEFIGRPRFLAITEFAPQNIIYHEGAKYQANRLIAPPGGLQTRRLQGKICHVCGYFQSSPTLDLCENCQTRLDASSSEIIPLLEMSNIKTWRRERITCDEEERLRMGYEVTSHFRFAPAPGGQKRTVEGVVYETSDTPILRMVYAPAAELYRINHGWRNRKERGFALDLATGEWLSRTELEDEDALHPSPKQPDVVRLFVRDTENLLLLYFSHSDSPWDENLQATLQYALQRGMEQLFQIEESEIASERIGSGSHRAILFWEAAEGGVGVLRRLVEERDSLAQVAVAALERCHFDPQTLDDHKPDCTRACYECLLSYTNQRDYPRLNRHLIRDFLTQLSQSMTHPRRAARDYDSHYRWLRSLTDTRSELERHFIDHIYRTRRRLPDEAQQPLRDYPSIPDFFCQPNICIFCDGSVHDEPEQQEKDRLTRQELKELGYRVIVIRYDHELEGQILQHQDIFGEGRK